MTRPAPPKTTGTSPTSRPKRLAATDDASKGAHDASPPTSNPQRSFKPRLCRNHAVHVPTNGMSEDRPQYGGGAPAVHRPRGMGQRERGMDETRGRRLSAPLSEHPTPTTASRGHTDERNALTSPRGKQQGGSNSPLTRPYATLQATTSRPVCSIRERRHRPVWPFTRRMSKQREGREGGVSKGE
jgi:hypothetical protein